MADIAKEYMYENIERIANGILAQTKHRPKLGIICGSGLGALADKVEDRTVINYADITGFPISTVPGHEGKLVIGKLGGKAVVLMQGRAHCYEGHPPQKIAIPVRTMKLMGVETLFVTNAAGGINRDYKVGDIMIMKDHINLAGFAGINPLVGNNDDKFGPRFPPMSNAYDRKLRDLAKSIAKEKGFEPFVREGVYCMMVGPNFETVTEARFLNIIGVDATGMSTVQEVLVARHAGMRVFGMSLITNMVISEYDVESVANHAEVLETGKARSKDLQTLVSTLVERMDL
ncbi:purine nucleoside phosphorylase-like [Littorina saxatilis]|uniref:Purine nucleoside phosphorylase n=1 Tax=Littorina saxatilis TaxID=31220 RepID=A0AAN9C0S8_9CAEN